ncbi:MAG TPA: hypothetical protein VGD77_06760 [Gemmatimonadaceae bacterium]
MILGTLSMAFAGTACAGSATGPVIPPAVAAAAHHGENVYDAVHASDWARASASLDSLRIGTRGLVSSGGVADTLRGQLIAHLDTLSGAVRARLRLDALREANEVTRLAAEASRPFAPSVPVEVTLLDYDGRLLELWAEQGNLAALHASTTRLRQDWQAVRARVEARPGGPAEATAFEALVVRAEAATTGPEFGAIAPPILDKVDSLEQLFVQTDRPD